MKKFVVLIAVLFLPGLVTVTLSQSLYVEPAQNASFANSIFLSAHYNPAGDLLGITTTEKTFKIIDAATLKEKLSLQPTVGRIASFIFSRDGASVITGNSDGQIVVWDAAKGTTIRNFSAHSGGVRAIALDNQGRIISGGIDKEVKIWDMNGGEIGQFPSGNTEVISIAVTPDGKNIAVGYNDGLIKIFDSATRTEVRSLSYHSSRVNVVQYSDDGAWLASGSADSSIILWRAQTGQLHQLLRKDLVNVHSLAFHPNNKILISSSKSIQCWDIATGALVKNIADTGVTLTGSTLDAKGSQLAAITSSGTIRVYKILEKKPDSTPPVVRVVQPAQKENETFQIYSNEIIVAGTVADESEISGIAVNGNPVEMKPATTAERTGIDTTFTVRSFSHPVPLTTNGSNSIVITAVDAAGNSATKNLRVVKLSKDAALEVLNPRENSDTDQPTINIEFKIWFDFSNYSIVLNTIELIKKDNLPRKPVGVLIKEQLSLSAGLNQLQITVKGRTGETVRKTINITRRILSAPTAMAPDQPIRPSTGQPQKWAVVVGLSEYGNPSIKNLNYADRDARDFAEFLKSPMGGGFEADRMKILLNKDATLLNIKSALFNFLRSTVDKDLVVVYFAGHGAAEPANADNNYLLCYDTDPTSLETSAFPMWDIKTALNRYIPSKHVVVFTDACHSGGISSDLATRGMSAADNNLINQYLADLAKTKEGIIVFTASQAGEVSQELDKFGHGVFTYYLLEGLKGKADANNDYTVTIGELMDYVEEAVKRQTKGNQHPTRNQGTYDKDLTIAVIPQ